MNIRIPSPHGLLSVIVLPVFICLFISPASAMGKAPSLDKASLECISCHASSISSGTSPDGPTQICHEAGCDHKIGADYAAAAALDKSLAPASALPPELKLSDGRMSCVTCHVPYSKKDHEALSARRAMIPEIPDPMLSVDNSGSALCLYCHLK